MCEYATIMLHITRWSRCTPFHHIWIPNILFMYLLIAYVRIYFTCIYTDYIGTYILNTSTKPTECYTQNIILNSNIQ